VQQTETGIHRFVEFGSSPAFIGLWELAATPERRDKLYHAHKRYVELYAQNLSVPGPYLTARLTNDFDASKDTMMSVENNELYVVMKFPTSK
jgi:hypothetical protein